MELPRDHLGRLLVPVLRNLTWQPPHGRRPHGGALAAGSANTINCYLDRDIDAVMRRTARRPLARPAPLAVIWPAEALAFGVSLGVIAITLLGLLVNWLAAALAAAAIGFYVFVYTAGLRRRTAANIVIGGAAGCFPVLVGWAAVTGTVGIPAVILFTVIFFWTPPHFWALAMRFKDDYAAAGVPMLPAVAPAPVVTRKILAYSWLMVAASLVLAPYAGWLYTACAALLGGWFLSGARQVHRGGRAPMRLFHQSIAYLTGLFAVVAITSVLPLGRW
jgi:heme o synthase